MAPPLRAIAIRIPSISAALCGIAGVASASVLAIDGQVQVGVAYGSTALVSVAGKPLAPALIWGDLSPGPVTIAGESVPLGLTAFAFPFASGTTDAAGSLTVPAFLPEDPQLSGTIVYFAALVVDAADPNGLDVSNGAALAILPPASAGADQATLVGRTVVLDGSAALGSATELPAGMSVAWKLVEKPASSAAAIGFPKAPFAILAPDVPGDYRARVSVSLGGASVSDECTVHAWELALTPEIGGTWTSIGVAQIGGTLLGPRAELLQVNGQPAPLAGSAFGPVLQVVDPADRLQETAIEIRHADGTAARARRTFGFGLAVPLGWMAEDALVVNLTAAGLEQVEASAAAELQAIDLEAQLLALPPTLVASDEGPWGFTYFSATVDFTSITYGATTIDLAPTAAGLVGTVHLHDVHATFDVWGVLLEIPYSLTGSMDSTPVDLSATVQFSAAGGTLHAAVSNPSVVRNNFSFDLDGFLGDVAQLFIIESFVQDSVESAVAGAIAQELGPALEEILGAYALAGSLATTIGADAVVAAPFDGVLHSADGIALTLDSSAVVGVAEPGSPLVTHALWTPTLAPSFGSTTPSGAPYQAALGAADDFLNQVLAAATGAGLLDGDPSDLLETGVPESGGTELTTDAFAALFPSAGFEHFPGGTPVTLAAHGTFAPVVTMTPGTPGTPGAADLARVELSGLELTVGVDSPVGEMPWLTLALDADVGLSLSVQPDGTLFAALGSTALAASVIQAPPGADPQVIDQALAFLGQLLLPQLAAALSEIPLPTLEAQGLGLLPTEVGAVGGLSEYAGFWGELALSPSGP
jgi:hypothetical protein